MHSISRFTILILIVGILLPIGCAKKTPQDKLQEAQQALAKKDILSAIIILEEIVEQHPEDPAADEARILLAQANLISGDSQIAIQHLDYILKKHGLLSPHGNIAFNLKLAAYEQEKQYDEALTFLASVKEDLTTTGMVLLQLNFAEADFYHKKGDLEKAIDILKNIVERATDEETMMRALERAVAIYEAEKNYEAAVELYENFLDSHPDVTFKHLLIGGIAFYHDKLGNHEKADALYNEAIEGFEKSIEEAAASEEKVVFMIQLGKLYTLRKEYDKALEIYEKVITDFPSDRQVPSVMMETAWVLSEKKDYNRAISVLNQMIQRYPNTPISQSAMSMVQYINQQRKGIVDEAAPTTGSEPLAATPEVEN